MQETEMHRGKGLLAKINVDANEKYVFMQKIDPHAFDDLERKISHFALCSTGEGIRYQAEFLVDG